MPYILIILACLGLVLLLGRKGKQNRKTDTALTDGRTVFEIPVNQPATPAPESSPPQVTIYGYSSRNLPRLCDYCDGENHTSADRCSICGKPLS